MVSSKSPASTLTHATPAKGARTEIGAISPARQARAGRGKRDVDLGLVFDRQLGEIVAREREVRAGEHVAGAGEHRDVFARLLHRKVSFAGVTASRAPTFS